MEEEAEDEGIEPPTQEQREMLASVAADVETAVRSIYAESLTKQQKAISAAFSSRVQIPQKVRQTRVMALVAADAMQA